jgi:xanthine dehydrogenase YagT iron-sulfur-binding subunit
MTCGSEAPCESEVPFLVPVRLEVNGEPVELRVDTRTSLLDLVRETLNLTGTKKGCDHGQCGACTMLVDGRRTISCLALAVTHQHAVVETIEGLRAHPRFEALRDAFVEHDALQCGYCTPGQLCSAVGMLAEVDAGWPSAATSDLDERAQALDAVEIRERMSGNLCRCGAYPNIAAAIAEAGG